MSNIQRRNDSGFRELNNIKGGDSRHGEPADARFAPGK